jgi:hypothetical protein
VPWKGVTTSVKTNKGVIINEEQVEIGPQALKRTRPGPFFILVGDWLHRSKISFSRPTWRGASQLQRSTQNDKSPQQ